MKFNLFGANCDGQRKRKSNVAAAMNKRNLVTKINTK